MKNWQKNCIDRTFEYYNICTDYSDITVDEIYKELKDINNFYNLGVELDDLLEYAEQLFQEKEQDYDFPN